ncbi:MAG TPA: hypothetical protein PLB90_09005 [Opitutaceae bacterium]|nr:hypothetical protein [Opitutaceae bacterium]
MKKWMYVISVGTMLAVFLVMYFSEKNRVEAREVEHARKAADDQRIERERKAQIEAKARADAEKRSAERAAEEAKKEAEKLAKWEEEGRKIQESTEKFLAEADASSKKAADLEIQLSSLRANKEKLNRETFELAKQVELGKVRRRAAEMEIQRTVEMISRKAGDSALSRPPAAPAPAS